MKRQSNQQWRKISVTLLNGKSHKQGLMLMSSEKGKGKKKENWRNPKRPGIITRPETDHDMDTGIEFKNSRISVLNSPSPQPKRATVISTYDTDMWSLRPKNCGQGIWPSEHAGVWDTRSKKCLLLLVPNIHKRKLTHICYRFISTLPQRVV